MFLVGLKRLPSLDVRFLDGFPFSFVLFSNSFEMSFGRFESFALARSLILLWFSNGFVCSSFVFVMFLVDFNRLPS